MPAPTGDRLRASDPLPSSGVLFGIDWGERRIGVAASDPSQTVAHPVGTLTRRSGRRFPLGQLHDHLERQDPVGFVVGLPLDPDGRAGPAAQAAYEAADAIAARTRLPIAYWDERMTTARARSAIRETGARARDHADQIDALAATILLQHFLDSRTS